jgi:hypothetical protein
VERGFPYVRQDYLADSRRARRSNVGNWRAPASWHHPPGPPGSSPRSRSSARCCHRPRSSSIARRGHAARSIPITSCGGADGLRGDRHLRADRVGQPGQLRSRPRPRALPSRRTSSSAVPSAWVRPSSPAPSWELRSWLAPDLLFLEDFGTTSPPSRRAVSTMCCSSALGGPPRSSRVTARRTNECPSSRIPSSQTARWTPFALTRSSRRARASRPQRRTSESAAPRG